MIIVISYTSTPTDTMAAGLKGGCDLNCGSFYQSHAMVSYSLSLVAMATHPLPQDAFLNGSITEEDIDRAVGRLFTARYSLITVVNHHHHHHYHYH